VKFDQERALKYLKQLCDIGPRISGSEGMKKQQELIEKHFKDLGATVTRQEFKARQRSRRERRR
jgi:glutaminyl-peptide cyclotransferase